MMQKIFEARKKIIGIAAIGLLVLFMMNLNSRLSEYFHLTGERDKLLTSVVEMRITKVNLDTQLGYATSDQAVEDWARNEAHMSRPGDQVVIPLTPADFTPAAETVQTPTPRAVANWEVWWALFFGQ